MLITILLFFLFHQQCFHFNSYVSSVSFNYYIWTPLYVQASFKIFHSFIFLWYRWQTSGITPVEPKRVSLTILFPPFLYPALSYHQPIFYLAFQPFFCLLVLSILWPGASISCLMCMLYDQPSATSVRARIRVSCNFVLSLMIFFLYFQHTRSIILWVVIIHFFILPVQVQV